MPLARSSRCPFAASEQDRGASLARPAAGKGAPSDMNAYRDSSWNLKVDAHHDLIEEATDALRDGLYGLIDDHATASEERRHGMRRLVAFALDGGLPTVDPITGRRSDPRRILDWEQVRDLDERPPDEILIGLALVDRQWERYQAPRKPERASPADDLNPVVDELGDVVMPDPTGVLDDICDAGHALGLMPFNGHTGRTRPLDRFREPLATAASLSEIQDLLDDLEDLVRARPDWKQEWDALFNALLSVFDLAEGPQDMTAWDPVMTSGGAWGSTRVEVLVATWIMQHALLTHRPPTGAGRRPTPLGLDRGGQETLVRWGYPRSLRQVLQQRRTDEYSLLRGAMENVFRLRRIA